MTFGEDWGWGASKEESKSIFNYYVECGGNFDTANGYTNGTSERLVGAFIRSDRDRFVVATKYTSPTVMGDPKSGGNHRKSMMRSLAGSLKRLGTDYVDLCWYTIANPSDDEGLNDITKSDSLSFLA